MFTRHAGSIFKNYSRLLEERPISTKILSSVVIMTVADIAQQYMEFRGAQQSQMKNLINNNNDNNYYIKKQLFWKDKYDKIRTLRMITFMAFFHVPYLHFWHLFLDARMLRYGITHPTFAVIAKVSVDQFISAPPYILWFLFATSMLEGKTVNEAKIRINENYKLMLFNCWKLWMPAHCITFSLPFRFRSVFCDCVRVYWGTLMSYYSNRSIDES